MRRKDLLAQMPEQAMAFRRHSLASDECRRPKKLHELLNVLNQRVVDAVDDAEASGQRGILCQVARHELARREPVRVAGRDARGGES